MRQEYARAALVALLAVGVQACGAAGWQVGETDSWQRSAPGGGWDEPPSQALDEPVPPPTLSDAQDAATRRVLEQALSSDDRRIVVSKEQRHLWLLDGDSVLFDAPVAIGRDTIFNYEGRSWDFSTPAGRHTVQGKETEPLWVPPDWHYFEKAVERDLQPVRLANDSRVELSDGTRIEVRGRDVGRVNQYGNFWAFTPGTEIIFDGKIFMPPFGTRQRQIPEVLGTHRLILGDGYLIHGTPEEDTIGSAASHGCVRMLNRDVARLYGMVDTGTHVFIY